ncbi:MAG TPA: acetate--CoA ligase family protein [Mycobacteriales bacterium]|nr:acetate--CoA ligase family protein [Mycobacteriales bacterium]
MTGRPTELRSVDLDRFFTPRTIAVIGASDTPHRPNTAMWKKIRAKAKAIGATIYPVNPNRETVDGEPCYCSIANVPADELDLVVILVGDPLATLPDVLARKAKFAVVFAADFAETGESGRARQDQLEAMLAASDTRLLGPNTNLNAFELFRDDLPGNAIALVTQSGHQGRPVFQGQELGIRLSHWAPTGNEADLEFADFASYYAEQPQVGAIAAYIEGFKDGRSLQLALDRCAQRQVPVVMVKVGRTESGSSMAQAHTGHLTGADAVVDAVFRQYGVNRVDGLDELLDVSAALARTSPPAGDGVCIYSISGGTGAHMADLVSAAGLRLAELSPATQTRLRELIPGYLRVSNPVDSGGGASADERGKLILDAILADPDVAMLVVPLTGVTSMGNRIAKDLVTKAAEHDKPVWVIWGSPVGNEPAYTDILLPSGLPVFRTFGNCVRALRGWFDTAELHARHNSPFTTLPAEPLPAATTARELLRSHASAPLSEVESKQLLAAYGVPVTEDVVVDSATEAVKAAGRLDGPAVLKINAREIAHKSDLGLVRLGLTSPAEIEAAYHEILAAAAAAAPEATLDGVIVSPMHTGGVETVVGVSQDPLFGPVLMVGIGGFFIEVLGDVSHRVPPFDAAEARRAIGELKGAKLLAGVRGAPAVDVDALVDVMLKVQRLALDTADDLAELDINPLLVQPSGAIALDALAIPTRK